MCITKLSINEINNNFSLEEELNKIFGKIKTKEILLQIDDKFKEVLPIKFDNFYFIPDGFNENGNIATEFNYNAKLF